jgi:tubulysin polyketide synthase-like protein
MDSHRSKETVAVISRLIGAGAKLWAEGERLRYSGPPGLLSDDDAAFIAERKADVLRVVTEGVELRCGNCGAIALAKPDERTDPLYCDLWQGWCGSCGSIFSQGRLLESDFVN